MASKKPVKKIQAKPAVKAAVKKALTTKAVAKPAMPATRPGQTPLPAVRNAEMSSCGCGPNCDCGPSCSCNNGMVGCLTHCCPVAKIVLTRGFWVASIITFLIVMAVDFVINSQILMPEYAATSSIWRPMEEVRMEFCLLAHALVALAYAAIIIGISGGKRLWGSMSAGVLAASPMAISSMMAYMSLPLASPFIPAMWAVSALASGALSGLAIALCGRLFCGKGCSSSCGC